MSDDDWDAAAVAYVQAIADTKLLLSQRYAENMMAGPVLEDDIAGASAAQDEIGHVRQLFRLLGQHGRENDWLEGDRDPVAFCNAATLDEQPADWPDFVVRMGLTERAAWYLIDAIEHADFAGLGERIGQDEYFHLEFLDARLESLAIERPAAVATAFERAVPAVLAFIGPRTHDADTDPVHLSGFTDRPVAAVRTGFREQYEQLLADTPVDVTTADWSAPAPDAWDDTRRRVGDGHIDAAVVAELQGVRNAEFAMD